MTDTVDRTVGGGGEFRPPPDRVDGFLPLRGYAVLGDGRSCALAGSDGAIDWWALPTMADGPTFGAVLDPQRGGRLLLRPTEEFRFRRCYVDGGAVLATEFRTPGGTVRVTDALTLGSVNLLPWTELARVVEVLDGSVSLTWEVVPGEGLTDRTPPWSRMYGDIPIISAGGVRLALVLDAVGDAEVVDGGFRGRFTATRGERGLLAVVATSEEPSPLPGADAVVRRVQKTTEHWSQWRELVDYDGPWRDAVARSALVHKQLTLADTGGLQAAATTSLPEKVGGTRNFDYRFSWVRDTSFALDALTSLELRGEVHAVMSFMLRAVRRTAPDVRVFYTMDGSSPPDGMDSVQLWSGYRGSQPVQVGNKASTQRQLGVYGHLLDALKRYVDHGNVLDGVTGQLVSQIADQVHAQWRLDDAGLWELDDYRPYTSSKLGCWVALDRAVGLAEMDQVPDDHVGRWRDTADEIRAYIDEACWSRAQGSCSFYAGTDDLDCATLLVARTGFYAPDDPRLHGTIDAIRTQLSAGDPLLYRYTGVRGEEGAFIACSFWLVEALVHARRMDEARDVMDAMTDLANDVGLLTEEMDPDTHEMLGNVPQALSHLALIGAATSYHHAARDLRSGG